MQSLLSERVKTSLKKGCTPPPLTPSAVEPSCSQSMLSSSPLGVIHTWKKLEEDMLVELRHSMNKEFLINKNHTQLWNAIASQLNAAYNIQVGQTQTMNKYYSLKMRWKEVVGAGIGTKTKHFRQRRQFDDMYGTTASTKPTFSIDSLTSKNQDNTCEITSVDSNDYKKSDSKLKKSTTKRKSTEIIQMMEKQTK